MRLLTERPVHSPSLPHKQWTRDECERLEAAGIDLERYELIEGELIAKMAKKHPQAFGRFFVLQEAGINVSPEDQPTSFPEPDVAVINKPFSAIPGLPTPADLVLVAEVSASAFAFDMTIKAGLYARAGITEYWVVDIEGRRLIVHREPVVSAYQSVFAYAENESVSPLAAPTHAIRVGDLF